jgi:hypothetical protein
VPPDLIERRISLPDRLRLLAELVPVLELPDADYGRWVATPPATPEQQ